MTVQNCVGMFIFQHVEINDEGYPVPIRKYQ